MKIYKSDGTLLLEVDVDDTSYRSRQIMGDHCTVLNFALAEYVEIPVGSYIDYGNTRFTLLKPHDVKMQHSRNYEYSITFHTDTERSKMWIFKNPVDGRVSFSLAATPREHLQMFIDNMNRRDSGWSIGECISGEEKLVSYDQMYCYDALALMADELNTEYEIIGKTVSLKKVEYNKDNPLALKYGGTGNGFKAGISRSNGDGDFPLEILYVQGGEQNIDSSKYGNRTLLMPKGQTIGYDGSKFEDEAGYDASKARNYIVSANGDFIQRQDKALASMTEASLDLSDIYPSRVGKISNVITVDVSNNFYDFTDADEPSDPCPNYEDCLIAGEQMTVIFQTGMLAGREFDVKFYYNSVTVRGETKMPRRFEIVPGEIDGVTMPNDTFKPAVGDKYIVFHCQLPNDYIRKDSSKSGASWRMFREAVKYMYDNEDYHFTFSGTIDGLWAKNDWVNIGAKIKLGGYISFTDSHFQAEPVLIRITDIKDYINNPHAPEIIITNETTSAGFGSAIKKIKGDKVEVEARIGDVTRYTQRGFRDAMETSKMLEQAMIDGYTKAVSPITAHVMQLLVGDNRLQFRFVTEHSSSADIITPSCVYDYETGYFSISNPGSGEYVMEHLTLGVTSMQPEHSVSEYYYWGVTDNQEFAVGDTPLKSYYVYIKCPKYIKGTTDDVRKDNGLYYATFVLSETAKPAEVGDDWYFLAGMLTSEQEQTRSFSQLYGFTEITGGRITTDRIVSSDGGTYFDLANNTIAGTIQFLNGLISGLIGIGNADGINAGLSGEGNDDDDVRMWAGKGITDRSSAPFRVQHDGKVIASNAEITGNIVANSGKIGGFTIKNGGLTNEETTNNAYITVNKSGGDTFASLGMNVHPSSVGLYGPGRFEVSRSYSYGSSANIAMKLSATGATHYDSQSTLCGNHALLLNSGYVTGLNFHIRRISATSLTVLNTDTVLIALGDGINQTFTFPALDKNYDGKLVIVKRIHVNGAVYLNSASGCNMWAHDKGTSFRMEEAGMAILIYDATNKLWLVNLVTGWMS